MIKHSKKIMDLHNHTTFSDGENTIEEIIKNSINYEIEVVGISDHFHQINDFDMYFRIIEYFSKMYSSQIQVLTGIEVDITKVSDTENTDVIARADYILIENLEYIKDIDIGLNIIKSYTRKYDLIIGLAHINFQRLIQKFGNTGLMKVLSFMDIHGIWWEINSNYTTEFYDKLLYSPTKEINGIVDLIRNYSIGLVAGSDTHSLEYFNYNRLKDANDYYKKLISTNK